MINRDRARELQHLRKLVYLPDRQAVTIISVAKGQPRALVRFNDSHQRWHPLKSMSERRPD